MPTRLQPIHLRIHTDLEDPPMRSEEWYGYAHMVELPGTGIRRAVWRDIAWHPELQPDMYESKEPDYFCTVFVPQEMTGNAEEIGEEIRTALASHVASCTQI